MITLTDFLKFSPYSSVRQNDTVAIAATVQCPLNFLMVPHFPVLFFRDPSFSASNPFEFLDGPYLVKTRILALPSLSKDFVILILRRFDTIRAQTTYLDDSCNSAYTACYADAKSIP